MSPRAPLPLLALALLAAPAPAEGNLLVVSKSPGFGVGFDEVQPAVDFAEDGDVILVRPIASTQRYASFSIEGKGVAVVTSPPTLAGERLAFQNVAVRDVPAGSIVLLKGLADAGALTVEDALGSVHVEDSSFSTHDQTGELVLVATSSVVRATSVDLVRCTFEGFDFTFQNFLCLVGQTVCKGRDGGSGLAVEDAVLRAFDCSFTGGSAERGSLGSPDGGDGGAGVDVGGTSALSIAGTSAQGGLAGSTGPAPPCGVPGTGGAGLALTGPAAYARARDSAFTPGTGTAGAGGCPASLNGRPVATSDGARFVALRGRARTLAVLDADPVLDGGTATLRAVGVPGDVVVYGFLDTGAAGLPGGGTGSPVSLPLPTTLLPLGVVPPSGVLDVPVPVPAGLVGYASGVPVRAVGLFTGPGGFFSTSGPAGALVVDALFGQPGGPHAELWVDDDAPRDLGPLDTLIGDPFEDGSAEHPFDSLREAVEAAVAGLSHTVRLEPGTYDGPDNDAITFGTKLLTIVGTGGAEQTVVVPTTFGFLFTTGGGAGLRGVTVTGAGEGAVIVGGATSPLFEDCVFDGNHAPAGGALSSSAPGVPSGAGTFFVRRCTFTDNTASTAGGATSAPRAVLEDCTLTGNAAGSFGGAMVGGAAVRCTLSGNQAQNGGGAYDVDLTDCTVTDNVAFNRGGGANQGSALRCTIADNDAGLDGGGTHGTTPVTESIVTGNTAGAEGGGVWGAALQRSVVAGNTAGGSYGGARATTIEDAFIVDNVSAPDGFAAYATSGVRNATISGNDGGGIYLFDTVGPITNSIVWGNVNGPVVVFEAVSLPTLVTVKFSDIEGGLAAVQLLGLALPNHGAGIFDADPLFVGGGDYHLTAGSPCIDAGDPVFAPRNALDVDGDPRVQGAAVDVGADEH